MCVAALALLAAFDAGHQSKTVRHPVTALHLLSPWLYLRLWVCNFGLTTATARQTLGQGVQSTVVNALTQSRGFAVA